MKKNLNIENFSVIENHNNILFNRPEGNSNNKISWFINNNSSCVYVSFITIYINSLQIYVKENKSNLNLEPNYNLLPEKFEAFIEYIINEFKLKKKFIKFYILYKEF